MIKNTIACIYKIDNIGMDIGEHIYIMLDEIKKYIDYLVIICSGDVTKEHKHRLVAYSDEIYPLMNKLVPDEWDLKSCIYQYENILILGDSMYGPFCSMHDLFECIKTEQFKYLNLVERDALCDENADFNTDFVVLKVSVFKKMNIIAKHKGTEYCLISEVLGYLEKMGYEGQAYLKSMQTEADCKEEEDIFRYTLSYDLIKKYNCPLVSRHWLIRENLVLSVADDSRKTLQYIEKATNYDVELIYHDIIRKQNIYDIQRSLQLDYILPTNSLLGELEKIRVLRVAIVIHLHYVDLLDSRFEYISRIPEFVDVFITSSDDDCDKKIIKKCKDYKLENCRIIRKENRGRDVSALLVACREYLNKYEYVCFVHDKKKSGSLEAVEAKYWLNILWDNTIGSEMYIYNILSCFEENKKIGLLTVPPPEHGALMKTVWNAWSAGDYAWAQKVMEKINISGHLEWDKQPLALGMSFWCRVDAMKPLFEYPWSYEDFPEEPIDVDTEISHGIERILPIVAQNQGFYSGICMTVNNARCRMENMKSMLKASLHELIVAEDVITERQLYNIEKRRNNLIKYCVNVGKVYIYANLLGSLRSLKELLVYGINIEGIIIPDERLKETVNDKRPVFYMDELRGKEDIGVIVEVNEDQIDWVIKRLEQKEIYNYYIY